MEKEEKKWFSKPSDRKTHTLTLTYLERDPASGDRNRDLNESSGQNGDVVSRFTARMFVSAFVHCALTLAQIPLDLRS